MRFYSRCLALAVSMAATIGHAQDEPLPTQSDPARRAPRGIPPSALVPLQLQRAGPPPVQPAPAQQPGAQPASGVIHLVCIGAGSANKLATTTGFAFNNYGGSAWGQMLSERSQPFEDQVNLQINDDDTGRIRLPRTMLPIVRGGENGWMKLKDIQRTDIEITGTATVNPFNNPKIRLDRTTGHISIDGKAGQYAGVCERYDPSATAKKF